MLAPPTQTLKPDFVSVSMTVVLRHAIRAMHLRQWEADFVCVILGTPAMGPQVARYARQESIAPGGASRARAPAHAARMAPPQVPSRMGQATTVTN